MFAELATEIGEFSFRYADLARAVGGEIDGRGARGGFFSDIHAFTEKLHVFIRQGSFTFKAIRFFNVAFRGEQSVRQSAVIG